VRIQQLPSRLSAIRVERVGPAAQLRELVPGDIHAARHPEPLGGGAGRAHARPRAGGLQRGREHGAGHAVLGDGGRGVRGRAGGRGGGRAERQHRRADAVDGRAPDLPARVRRPVAQRDAGAAGVRRALSSRWRVPQRQLWRCG